MCGITNIEEKCFWRCTVSILAKVYLKTILTPYKTCLTTNWNYVKAYRKEIYQATLSQSELLQLSSQNSCRILRICVSPHAVQTLWGEVIVLIHFYNVIGSEKHWSHAWCLCGCIDNLILPALNSCDCHIPRATVTFLELLMR